MIRLPARGLLFDNDGVLVDSDAAVTLSWSRWACEHRLDPAAVVTAVHGRRSADTVAVLIPGEGAVAATALIDAYELEDAAAVTALPGAAELLGTLPRELWAVVTSGSRPLASARLCAAGLPLPDVSVTADDVQRGKPDPQGYLAAAAALGVQPSDTIVLEDSAAGVAAGLAAGALVLGVSERALDTGARIVVRDLSAVHWDGAGLLLDAAGVLRAP